MPNPSQQSQVVPVDTSLDHDDTPPLAAEGRARSAFRIFKQVAQTVADEAAELAKRAGRSEMGKDAITGAGIGAAVAAPVPVIGPVAGAILGGGAGIAINLVKVAANAITRPMLRKDLPRTRAPICTSS